MTRGVTQAQRLDFLDRDLRDHSKSLTALTDGIADLGKRITALEEANLSYRVYIAREEERDKALQARLSGIETSLNGIKGGFNKLLWIIGTGVIGAFVAFIIKGGLAL